MAENKPVSVQRPGGAGHGPGGGPGRHGYQKPKDLKGTLAKLMRYLGRYKAALCLVAVLLVVSSACTVGGSYLIKPLINDYILPGDFPGLAKMLAFMGCVYVVGAACSFGYARIMVHVSQNTVAKIRSDLFDRMQSLPLKYFDTHTHGELMSRYTNDIETVSEALNNSFGSLISCTLNFVGTIAMMIVLSPLLTLITFAMLAVMLSVVKVIGGRSRRYFASQQAAIGAVNGYIEEMIEGQKVIKVFNHEEAAKAGFAGLNEDYRQAATRAQAYAGAMMPAMGNLSYINYAITCCVGAMLAISGGSFRLGDLGAFLQYTRQVSQPITQISQQVNTILAAVAGAERVFEVMETEPEVDEGKVRLVRVTEGKDGALQEAGYDTGEWAWKKPDGTLVPLRGDVRFDHVVFGYDPRKTILHDISLYAKPGQKIAFVGSTGAGKTTITSLINRFYEIQSGTITYDGIDVRDIEKDSLRRSLGVVLQDTHLFTGTVADNIRYGRLDATDEEVEAAARLAGADTFIRHLPHGYDTVLSGDGGNLSQGERQLLNIARAACANPPVLILDEATSSIDTRTEKIIEKGMDRLMAGRTVFVIAHRLSTVRNAKAIMVLEQGVIIERGDHDDLIAQKGRYYQLYTGQAELS
ncbi:ABC transporter ATP-binding protein [uncultured Oscillibacter sp.]|uniref:ABC transporter ATP-binding protein n=2 Tax=uncultured Oscillibacter sp. TaxID=876091 RepID=UPI0025E5EBFE|nr:ABC transporter ATP-binding protein [uncultured Oscillibacter sp.]